MGGRPTQKAPKPRCVADPHNLTLVCSGMASRAAESVAAAAACVHSAVLALACTACCRRAAPSTQPALPELPEAVLISILQHVPIHDRLARCVQVSKALARAAAKAATAVRETTALPLVVANPQRCKQLQAWLQQWGHQVTSVDVEYNQASNEESDTDSRALLLPASQLSQLQTL